MLGMKKIKSILLLLLVFNAPNINAQFYNQGSESASTKWSIIKTENFKIIYPKQIDSLARRYAVILENDRKIVNKLHSSNVKKFPVVLHPNDVFSNGLVVWAPKRAEFKTTPQSFYGYPQLWEKQLSIHEQRHIFQMMHFEKGFFKPLSLIIGQQAAGVGVGLYLSKWELEGDAVFAETEYSNSGRGRDPEFLIYYKTAFLGGELRKLHNWSLGTIKKYEPDHYSFGYYFLSNLSNEFGKDIFESALKYRLKNPLDLNGSNNSYKSFTGVRTKNQIFNEIQKSSIEKCKLEDSLNAPYSSFKKLTKKSKDYQDYESLSLLPDGLIVAIRENLDNVSELGMIDSSGNFKKLTNAGFINSGLKSAQNKIFWSESVPSVRWEQLSYSRIVCFDINTKTKKYFSGKTRLFNPVPFDNETIISVEYPVEGSSYLVFIDIDSEKIIKKIKAPGGYQIKEVVATNGEIFLTLIEEGGISLMVYSPSLNIFTKVKEFTGTNVSYLWAQGEKLYFRATQEGKNNLYCYDIKDRVFSKPLNIRFAAKAPLLDSAGNLIYLNYDINGYSPVITNKDELKSDRVIFRTDKVQEKIVDSSYVQLPSKKYSKLPHSLNIHSWAPVYYDVDELRTASFSANEIPVKPGFMLMSQDLLSTTFAMAGYSYSKGFNAGHIRFKYSGITPIVEISADLNERKAINFYRSEDPDNPGRYTIKSDNLNKPHLRSIIQSYIPLNFSSGGRSRYLVPQFAFKYKNDSYSSAEISDSNPYNQFVAAVQYYDIKNLAKRNIFPGNGFGLYGRYSSIAGTHMFFGPLLYLSGYLYIPGIIPNHGIKISAIHQKQFVTEKYFYQENVSEFVRGYEDFYADDITAFKFNYVFPVYVNQNYMLQILYVKRFQFIPFLDIATFKRGKSSGQIHSFGTDIIADFHLFGISFPFSGGIRYLHRADKKNDFQFILNMSL